MDIEIRLEFVGALVDLRGACVPVHWRELAQGGCGERAARGSELLDAAWNLGNALLLVIIEKVTKLSDEQALALDIVVEDHWTDLVERVATFFESGCKVEVIKRAHRAFCNATNNEF